MRSHPVRDSPLRLAGPASAQTTPTNIHKLHHETGKSCVDSSEDSICHLTYLLQVHCHRSFCMTANGKFNLSNLLL